MKQKEPKILAYPRDPNPYQELLYRPLRADGLLIDYLEGPTPSQTVNLFLLPATLLVKRLRGYNVLHVHWTWQFYMPWAKKAGRLPMQWLAGFTWRTARLLRFRLVWTAHNVLPQDQHFWNDVKAHRLLGNLADVVIVHNAAAREQLEEIGVHSVVRTIPHGSYVGAYPDVVSREAAREQLHLPADRTVLLCFGLIRPYKGIDNLLASYERLSTASKGNLTLLVAGPPRDERLVRQLRRAQRTYPHGIRLMLKFIPDEDVQLYFRAADFAVLPYQCSTTSGVAILALSFGCPVIVPNQAAFSDLPNAAQILYDTDRLPHALRDAIAVSLARHKRMSIAAQEYADALSWPTIARHTGNIFRDLCS